MPNSANSDSIKAGDIVKLKSGGQKMTAGYASVGQGQTAHQMWHCYWFLNGNLQEKPIPAAALKKTDPDPE